MTDIPNVSVPVGQSGAWRVERFTVEQKDVFLENLRSPLRAIHPGTYTRLMRGGTVVMSDTHAEKRDHAFAVWKSKGVVLINGLGLGVVVNAVLAKPEVERVCVIEKSKDVIDLVAPHYVAKFGERFQVIHCCALQYQPPRGIRYGAVWHDIWDAICSDNLKEMAVLHRRYGRRTEWQGSWGKAECQIAKHRYGAF